MNKIIAFIFLILMQISFGQIISKEKKNFFHVTSSPYYIYQGTHNFNYLLGLHSMNKKTHSYVDFAGGILLFRLNKITYLAPTINLEGFYRLKTKRTFGPVCKISLTHYKVLRKVDNALSVDIGFKIFKVSIFGGYNFNLDSKDIMALTNYRIGIGIHRP